MDIPILIICYNNYKYVENTINQINKINQSYYKNIIVVNNNSNDEDTNNYLKKKSDIKIIWNKTNNGPWITPNNNQHIYNRLPDKFIITDPDLEFNQNIPNNFIEIMEELSEKYKANKIGLALKIDDFNLMYQSNNYMPNKNIYEWEIAYWKNKINDLNYELYYAPIDTTFCLINKNYGEQDIRIAGNFTAKHLPWYIDNPVYNTLEKYEMCKKQTQISTISRIIIEYTEKNKIIN